MVMDAKIFQGESVGVTEAYVTTHFREANKRVRTDLGPDIDRCRNRLSKQND
jgi:hypothetical protein